MSFQIPKIFTKGAKPDRPANSPDTVAEMIELLEALPGEWPIRCEHMDAQVWVEEGADYQIVLIQESEG